MRRRSTVSTWTKPAARMPGACAVRNCFHVGPVRRGAGADPGVMQDLPHRGCCDRVAELDEFALHPPVSPARIVDGHADNELADRGCRARPPGTPTGRVVPCAC